MDTYYHLQTGTSLMKNFLVSVTIEQSDSLKAERDMYQALKARKEALEESLKKKIEELKLLCLQEGVHILYLYIP